MSEPVDEPPRRGDMDVARFAPRRVAPGWRPPARTLLLVMTGLAVLEAALIAGSLLSSLGPVGEASPSAASASPGTNACPTADIAPRGPLPLITDQPVDRPFAWIGSGSDGITIGSLAGAPERPLGVPVLHFDIRVARLSPAGNAVAFDAARELRCGDVYVVRVTDSTVVRLSDGAADTIDRAPAWSPDGGSLAYLSYHAAWPFSTADVHLATAANGTDVIVASVHACRIEGTLFFSPDGRRVAVDCGETIVVIDLRTGTTSQVASGTGGGETLDGWTLGGDALVGGAFLRVIDATTMQTLRHIQLPSIDDVSAALGLDARRLDPRGGLWGSTELAPDGSMLVATMFAEICQESGCTDDGPTTSRSVMYVTDTSTWDWRLLVVPDGWVDRVVVTPWSTILYTAYGPGPSVGTFAVDLANPTPRRISDRIDPLVLWNGAPW